MKQSPRLSAFSISEKIFDTIESIPLEKEAMIFIAPKRSETTETSISIEDITTPAIRSAPKIFAITVFHAPE